MVEKNWLYSSGLLYPVRLKGLFSGFKVGGENTLGLTPQGNGQEPGSQWQISGLDGSPLKGGFRPSNCTPPLGIQILDHHLILPEKDPFPPGAIGENCRFGPPVFPCPRQVPDVNIPGDLVSLGNPGALGTGKDNPLVLRAETRMLPYVGMIVSW